MSETVSDATRKAANETKATNTAKAEKAESAAKEAKDLSDDELQYFVRRISEVGGTYSLLYIDAYSASAEDASNALLDLIARLQRERGVLYCKGVIEKSINLGNGWSCCAEVKLLTDSFATLLLIVMRYAPTAIELIEPMEVKLSAEAANALLLDCSKMSQDWAYWTISRVLDEEDLKRLNEHLRSRAALGELLRKRASEGSCDADSGTSDSVGEKRGQ